MSGVSHLRRRACGMPALVLRNLTIPKPPQLSTANVILTGIHVHVSWRRLNAGASLSRLTMPAFVESLIASHVDTVRDGLSRLLEPFNCNVGVLVSLSAFDVDMWDRLRNLRVFDRGRLLWSHR